MCDRCRILEDCERFKRIIMNQLGMINGKEEVIQIHVLKDFSDMTRIPSKCEKCLEDFPSQRAMQAHRVAKHGSKGNGTPNLKAPKPKDAENKPASPAVMNRWIQGNTRSNLIARSKSEARKAPKKDTPRVPEPGTRTDLLNTSVSLLDSPGAAASPTLNTLRMFPPSFKATPSGDSLDSWIVSQVGDSQSQSQPSSQPETQSQEQEQDTVQIDGEEKSKRGREDYEDELEPEPEKPKRVDEKTTPENMRGPRNLDLELLEVQTQETQNALELEFNSEEIETQEWNVGAEQLVNNLDQFGLPGPEGNPDISEFQTLRPDQLLSRKEEDWLTSSEFVDIPDREPQSEDQEDLEDQETDMEYETQEEAEYELTQAQGGIIEDLRSKLDDAESAKFEFWERIGLLEAELKDLKLENQRLKDEAGSSSLRDNAKEKEVQKLQEAAQLAEAKIASLQDAIKSKEAELKMVKAESLKLVNQASSHVESVRGQADQEIQLKLRAAEQAKRAEVEHLKAINLRVVDELKKSKEGNNEIIGLKTALAKLEAQNDLEKHKAVKAENLVTKLEGFIRDAQTDKADKEVRIRELENRNKIQARQIQDQARLLPCKIVNCDFGCGKDHHCGSGRNRDRNQPQNRRRASESEAPTARNLAFEAGCSVENMNAVIHEQVQAQDQGHPQGYPHHQQGQGQHLNPQAGRGRAKSKKDKKWRVTMCADWHRTMCCPRGYECRNAHQLIGAKDVAMAQSNDGKVQNKVTQIRPRQTERTVPTPAFHPDHPWAKLPPAQIQAQLQTSAQASAQAPQASGNEQGQHAGAPAVLPQAPRRTFKQAASGEAAARVTVKESLTEISSNKAQLEALNGTTWRRDLDKALAVMRRAFPGSLGSPTSSRTASQSSASASQEHEADQ